MEGLYRVEGTGRRERTARNVPLVQVLDDTAEGTAADAACNELVDCYPMHNE